MDNPPTVQITNPSDGSTVSGTIIVTAEASDDKGISKVEFYLNDSLKSTDINSVYQWSWDTTQYSDGGYTIKAVAYATANQPASDTVSVTVNNEEPISPPTVTITAGPSGTIDYNDVTFTWSGSDSDGQVVGYYYELDDPTPDNWTTETSHTFNDVSEGAHTFYVKAKDDDEAISSAASRNFTCTPPENQSPTCAVELRKEGATSSIGEINIGESFDIYVGDSTPDTSIDKVRFSSDDFQDGSRKGEWTGWYGWSSSSGDWNPETKIKKWSFATSGTKEVWAEVKDNIGQTNGCSANIYVPVSLLEKYAPVLYFHPDEEYLPWGIGSMLEKAEMRNRLDWFEKTDPTISTAQLKSDFNKKRYYLNFPNYSNNSPPPAEWWVEEDYHPIVYGRQVSKPGFIILQYWFFYPYNNWTGTVSIQHEGDWEMAQVRLDDAKDPKPLQLSLAWHKEGSRYSWDELYPAGTTHPELFVALGGHGLWASSNTTSGSRDGKHDFSGVGYDLTSDIGRVLYPEHVDSSLSYKLEIISDETDWVDWEGQWGEQFNVWGENGPRSPAWIEYPKDKAQRWKDPVGWANGLAEGNFLSQSASLSSDNLELSDLFVYPNPAHGEGAKFHFHLSSSAKLTIKIYNIAGELVRTLIEGKTYPMGTHEEFWRKDNDKGEKLARGAYIYIIQAGDSDKVITKSGKITLLD